MARRCLPSISTRQFGIEGFTLVEVMLGLLLMALIASLALPGLRRAAGPAALRASAYQISALLRDDRTRASSLGRSTSTTIDSEAGRIRSSASGEGVALPGGATIRMLGGGAQAISFYADGRSSGGGILLQGTASRIIIAVSPDTGAIRFDAP